MAADEPTAEVIGRVCLVLDFLGEAIPAWLEKPDTAPPSQEAAAGLYHIVAWLAYDLRSLTATGS